MNMLNTLLARRSVRQYTAEPIPEETLNAILHAGLAAPSSKNRRPWAFVLVTQRETLDALSACRASGAAMLKQAAAAIVVCGDQENVDVWVEDCACAMANMHLMASASGIGSCWIQGRLRKDAGGRSTEDAVRTLLGIPEKYGVAAILSLGMPEKQPLPHTLDELPLDKIHREHFRYDKEN